MRRDASHLVLTVNVFVDDQLGAIVGIAQWRITMDKPRFQKLGHQHHSRVKVVAVSKLNVRPVFRLCSMCFVLVRVAWAFVGLLNMCQGNSGSSWQVPWHPSTARSSWDGVGTCCTLRYLACLKHEHKQCVKTLIHPFCAPHIILLVCGNLNFSVFHFRALNVKCGIMLPMIPSGVAESQASSAQTTVPEGETTSPVSLLHSSRTTGLYVWPCLVEAFSWNELFVSHKGALSGRVASVFGTYFMLDAVTLGWRESTQRAFVVPLALVSSSTAAARGITTKSV